MGSGIVAFIVSSHMHRGKSLYKYHPWLSTQNWPGQWTKMLGNSMVSANKRAVKERQRTKAGGLDEEEKPFSLERFEWEGQQTESVRASALSKSTCTGSCILTGMLLLGFWEDHMLEGGGLHDTVLLVFLVGVDIGVSQICCLGPGASLALHI